MIELKSDRLVVSINEVGAEVSSVKTNDDNKMEYIWQADSNIWPRHAPVLFPIVGALKNNEYIYNGNIYHMGQHGFARDMKFDVENMDDQNVTFVLRSNFKTKEVYPFIFELKIHYTLNHNHLLEHYEVTNPSSSEDLLFSIGGHPGFNLNLESKQIEDDVYKLCVDPDTSYERINLQGAFIDLENKQQMNLSDQIPLTPDFFDKGTLILKKLNNNLSTIGFVNKSNHGVAIQTTDAPYMGIWSHPKSNGSFVCIEPWWGIADEISADRQLINKLGINTLNPNESFNKEFEIIFY